MGRPAPSRAVMWLTVAGCLMLLMSLSAITYFGAILNYLASYYKSHTPALIAIDPLWMLTLYNVCGPIGMCVLGSSGVSVKKATPTVTFFVLLNITAAFCGFVSIREPLALLITYSVIQGFCSGAIYNLIWKLCMARCPARVAGTATGIMGAGTPLGALFISELALLVVNPANAARGDTTDGQAYFSDPELLTRVPYMFVMHGTFCSVIHLTGLVLLYVAQYLEQRSVEPDSLASRDSAPSEYASSTRPDVLDNTGLEYGTFGGKLAPPSGRKVVPSSTPNTDLSLAEDPSGATSLPEPIGPYINESLISSLKSNTSVHSVASGTSDVTGLSPCQAMNTSRFWVVWVTNVLLNVTLYIYMGLYKEFGVQTFNNDALLTNAGVLGNVCMAVSRPLYGVLVDRWGSKVGLVATTSSSSVFVLLTMLSILRSSPWAYVVAVVGEINCIGSLWQQFNYSAKSAFGHKHYSANVGLLFTAVVPGYVALPALLPWMVAVWGWMNVFFTAQVFAVASFFLSLLYFPPPEGHWKADDV